MGRHALITSRSGTPAAGRPQFHNRNERLARRGRAGDRSRANIAPTPPGTPPLSATTNRAMRASSVIVSSVLRLLGFSKSKRIGRYLRRRGGAPDPGDLDAPAGPPFAVCRPYWREGPVNLPRARRCHTPLFPRSVLLHHRAGVAAPGSIDVAGRTNRMIWAWVDTDPDDNDAPAGWVSYKYLAWPLSRSRLNPDNSCAYDRLTNGFLISPPIGAIS